MLASSTFMARLEEQKTPRKPARRRRVRNHPAATKISFDVNPRLRRDAAALAVALLAVVAFLAVFLGSAGPVGSWLDQALASLFGYGRYVAPLVILYVAGRLAFPEKFQASFQGKLGFTLFATALLGLVNLLLHPTTEAMLFPDNLAGAGGYFGLILGYPALAFLGFWAGLVALAALLLLAFGLTFNASLEELAARFRFLRGLTLPSLRWPRRGEAQEYSGFERREAPTSSPVADALDGTAPRVSAFPTPAAERMTTPADQAALPLEAASPKRIRRYNTVPTDLLEASGSKPQGGDISARQFTIKKTLENFGIPVEMADISVGPTVTQYALKPADGIKLSRITGLSNDLALSLAAHPIRIEAPIPGKSLVGIEVPNHTIAIVSLREILESREFRERKSSLSFAIGKDVAGKPWVGDLARMPHMLVAGATGSGKTVCLNSILVSLLYANTPETLRLILVDPKRVELPVYNGLPHLLCPAITEVPKTINALKWAIGEMDRRFEVLSKAGKRDISAYNEDAAEKMPFIVIVIDELADLMVASAAEVEASIIRLAQMARAVGIHLIVATQRPSVDVITGLIKANITARVAFSVASSTDSRTIIDTTGAEKLVGRGDSLFVTAELSRPKRIQCCFVSDREIRRVVDFITSQLDEPVQYTEAVTDKKGAGGASLGGSDDDDDELLDEAQAVIVQAGKASASFLQRRLKVGYARAARLLDLLEERGIIGPGDGAKPRDILVSAISDVDGIHVSEDTGEDA